MSEMPDSSNDMEQGPDEAVETTDAEGLQHVRIEIRRSLTHRRLDKYLAGRLGKQVASRAMLQKLIDEGRITVNDRPVKRSYIVQAGDRIDLVLPAPQVKTIPPEPIPLKVVYEDDDLIAVNKQDGLIVHPARGNWSGTLLNALAYYFQQHDQSIGDLPLRDEAYRPGVVHRLDRDTTGIILLAKSERALRNLGRQFEDRKISKTYIGIVHGHVELDEDVIDLPIGQHARIKEKYAVDRRTGRPFGGVSKPAVTRYHVRERLGGGQTGKPAFTLLELCPKTGRTHQLRVHCSFIGHPIVGDHLYGGGPLYRSQLAGHGETAEDPIITRQALHAWRIEFRHPADGRKLALQAEMPDDFVTALEALRDLGREA